MIRGFYKYARNQLLGDILNNFDTRNRYELFLYVHQCQSRWNAICFYSFKIQMSEKDEPQSNFLN